MLERLRTTLNPARYHGRVAGRPFFEGWYFKVVDRSGDKRYAIIPGVFRGATPAGDHAFVQVLDGVSGKVSYYSYPVEAFLAATRRFEIWAGPNHFTAEAVDLALEGPQGEVRGRLAFHGQTPWPVRLLTPGIMGPYAWAPFMECYHGVVSLDHGVAGSLRFGGEEVDFAGGRGYIEKDWGRSFPAAWVWCQCNHFERPGTSLTASVAVIPWLRGAFPGFIVGFLHQGTLYRFATYTGARTERLEVGDERILWTVGDRRHRLEMALERAGGGILRAPSAVDMDRRIVESLNATVDVRLSATGGGERRLLFAGQGRYAGLEAAGDLPRLLQLYRAAAIPKEYY